MQIIPCQEKMELFLLVQILVLTVSTEVASDDVHIHFKFAEPEEEHGNNNEKLETVHTEMKGNSDSLKKGTFYTIALNVFVH